MILLVIYEEELAMPPGHEVVVRRVRQPLAEEGPDATPHRKRPTRRQYREPHGAREAKPVALACSPAPEGQARWTMKLLAEQLVELEVVASADPSAVCRALQETS